MRGDDGPDTLRQMQGLLRVRAGQQRNEFLAAEPGNQVSLAQLVSQKRRDVPQHLIAGVVAEVVVDTFEVVQVTEQHRKRPSEAKAVSQLLLERLLEVAGVVEPRLGIELGQVGQVGGAGELVGEQQEQRNDQQQARVSQPQAADR